MVPFFQFYEMVYIMFLPYPIKIHYIHLYTSLKEYLVNQIVNLIVNLNDINTCFT